MKLRMYLVISFDFCGSSDVKIHILTQDKEKALKMYNNVLKLLKLDNEDETYQLQLVSVPDDFSCKKGYTLFWGKMKNFNDKNV